ncbi:MAG: hypothetical protein ACHQQQ_07340 [Bacteroidota bacterium]
MKFSQVNFPFSVCKSESPDFIIHIDAGKTIGIEHREITTEPYQQYLTESLRQPSIEPVFLDRFKLGGSPENENNSGWVGNGVEQEWVELALRAICDKQELLNKDHYKQLDSYDLLLYSNTYLSNVKREIVMPILSDVYTAKCRGRFFKRLFNSVTIIYGDEVWFRALKFLNE